MDKYIDMSKDTLIAPERHLCYRNPDCECQQFILSNLSSLFADNDPLLLTSDLLYQTIARYCSIPEVHLPFKTFVEWIQLELYLRHYPESMKYIKTYLSHSRTDPNDTKLPLSQDEYYELAEILVFHCIYLYQGYEAAYNYVIKDTHMTHLAKGAFIERLHEIAGKPLESYFDRQSVMSDSRLAKTVNSRIKSMIMKHKWKIVAALGCVFLWLMLKTGIINKLQQAMSFFRSEEMGLYKLMFEYNDRWKVMENMGTLGALHFIEVNSSIRSKREQMLLSRCDDCEEMIIFLSKTASDYGVEKPVALSHSEVVAELERYSQEIYQSSTVDYNSLFEYIERDLLKKMVEAIKRNVNNLAHLHEEAIKLQLHCKALEVAEQMFTKAERRQAAINNRLNFAEIKAARVIAVINRASALSLQKLLFRTMKGNVLAVAQDLPEPIEQLDGKKEYKQIMLILFKEGEHTNERVAKACSAYADLYLPVPEDIELILKETRAQLKDINRIKQSTKGYIKERLSELLHGEGRRIRLQAIKYFINKFKGINTTLSKMVICGGVYEGLCWCPTKDEEKVISEIKKPGAQGAYFIRIPHRPDYPSPPTSIKTNDFLRPFQDIVNTYGIPSYKEINPAYFTIITFPFLYGIMFGDILHGAILAFTGIYLLWANKRTLTQTGSFLAHFWPYRYLILLLGIFSTYCGLIYNEVGSLPLMLFKSCFNEKNEMNCTYPIGFDPKWKAASNDLIFGNSYKMKFSTIIACLHIMLGICLKGLNSLLSGNTGVFFCEFIPEMLFTLTIIGYLTVLIVYKWLVNWPGKSSPPSILTMVSNVFLKPAQEPTVLMFSVGAQLMVNTLLFGTLLLLPIIIVVAIISVQWLFLTKPALLAISSKEEALELPEGGYLPAILEAEQPVHAEEIWEANNRQKVHVTETWGEMFLHQIIHTIEFALGTLSNSASYLRLWALSLAHCQLSTVFLDLVVLGIIDSPNPAAYKVFPAVIILGGITFGILIAIDALECFLHALRLHWVEFQGKFYKGEGYLFAPFSFQGLVKSDK